MAEVVKYRKPIRVLHWIHSGSFVLLFLTGLILFIPGLAFLAEDSWTRVIHRVGAVLFIVIPIIYLIISPKGAMAGLKKAFSWNSDDMGWLKAAPRYYFLGDKSNMPAPTSNSPLATSTKGMSLFSRLSQPIACVRATAASRNGTASPMV